MSRTTPFGNAGGARGVEDIQRIGREHRHAIGGFLRCHRLGPQLGPVVVAPGDEFAGLLWPLQDDAGLGLDAGKGDRFVEQRLVLHDAAGLEPAARREDQFRLGVLDPCCQLLGGEAAEHHRMHCADPAQASIATTASGTIGI